MAAEHMDHPSGLRIPIPIPISVSPTSAEPASRADDEDVSGPPLLTRPKSDPDSGTPHRSGSLDVTDSNWLFSDAVGAGGGPFVMGAQSTPSGRSALSTPGTQSDCTIHDFAFEQATAARASYEEVEDLANAAARSVDSGSFPSSKPAKGGILSSTRTAPGSAAAAPTTSSRSRSSSPSSAVATPLFEVHSGLRRLTSPSPGNETSSNQGEPTDAAAATATAGSGPSADAPGAGTDLATVSPHQLPTQVQLCLRYAYGAKATAEQLVQEAPPPYRMWCDVQAMSAAEHAAWVAELERAWFAKLRGMPPWNRNCGGGGSAAHVPRADVTGAMEAPASQTGRGVAGRAPPQHGGRPTPTPPPPPPRQAEAATAFGVQQAYYVVQQPVPQFRVQSAYPAAMMGALPYSPFVMGHHHQTTLEPVFLGPNGVPFVMSQPAVPMPVPMVVVPSMMPAVSLPTVFPGGSPMAAPGFYYSEGGVGVYGKWPGGRSLSQHHSGPRDPRVVAGGRP